MTNGNAYPPEERRLNRLLDLLVPPAPSDLLRARIEKALDARSAGPAVSGAGKAPRAAAWARTAAALLLAAAVAVASWMPAPGDGPTAAGGPPQRDGAAWAAVEPNPHAGEGIALVGADGGGIGGVALVRAAWDEPAAGATTNALATEDDLDLVPLD